MGGRLVRFLVISALFLTFIANFIFVLQTRECARETQIFPWIKNNMEIAVAKQENFINVASRQKNIGKRIIVRRLCQRSFFRAFFQTLNCKWPFAWGNLWSQKQKKHSKKWNILKFFRVTKGSIIRKDCLNRSKIPNVFSAAI